MTWQDVVLAVGQVVFAAALIPMLRAKRKPPLKTSIPTGLFLIAFAVVYASLHLTFAMVMASIAGCLWLTLACQAIALRNT